MIWYNISRLKTANCFAKGLVIHGGTTQSPANAAPSHGTQKSTIILRERFVAILGLPSLIGSNTSLKNAPFDRGTRQQRCASWLGRLAAHAS